MQDNRSRIIAFEPEIVIAKQPLNNHDAISTKNS